MPAIPIILKAIGPYLIKAVLIGLIWLHGYNVGQEDYDALRDALKKDAQERKERIGEVQSAFQIKMKESNEQGEQIAKANRLVIEDLVDRNSTLLNDRVRRETNHCRNSKVTNTGTTATSDEETTGSGTFLEMAGGELVEKVKEADEIVESLRLCQSYVTSLKEQIDETWNRMESSKH
jgi:hypothetical protein